MEAANKIAIITDTCCDLPQEYLKEYPIFCVPLVVTSGTESYRDYGRNDLCPPEKREFQNQPAPPAGY